MDRTAKNIEEDNRITSMAYAMRISTYKGLVPLLSVTIRDGVEPGEGGEGGHTVSSVQSCLGNTRSINSTLELMQLNFATL